jgi:hypothetical protein
MTVSTATAVLRQAIVDWRDSFMGVTTHQAAGHVMSSVQNLCIDVHLTTNELPDALRAMYAEARRRSEGGRVGTFTASELVRAANTALKEL